MTNRYRDETRDQMATWQYTKEGEDELNRLALEAKDRLEKLDLRLTDLKSTETATLKDLDGVQRAIKTCRMPELAGLVRRRRELSDMLEALDSLEQEAINQISRTQKAVKETELDYRRYKNERAAQR